MVPSVGRIVHLRLSASCAAEINRRRTDARFKELGYGPFGNTAREGDILPLLICKVWSDQPTEQTSVNGQVFLDGNDTLWATSVQQGTEAGQWFDPRG